MCTGTEIGYAGLGLSAIGAYSGAQGARNSATAMQTQLRFNAQMAEINAELNESNAQATMIAGERQVQGIRLKTAGLKSAQRVSMAANGIDLGSDTAVNILTSTDLMGEIDAQTAASNAVRAAWGYRTQGTNAAAQAAFGNASANTINPGAAFSTSMLGSAGTVAMNWYMINKGAGITSTKADTRADA